jgi:hypothetical protein
MRIHDGARQLPLRHLSIRVPGMIRIGRGKSALFIYFPMFLFGISALSISNFIQNVRQQR